MDISEQKRALRREVFDWRRTAHRAGGSAARDVRDHALGAGLFTGAEVVAGYRPIRTEIDPTPLMEALAAGGARLCVPVIEGEGRPLNFREWWPDARMVPGPFGAEVPAEGDWLTPDALIVPLVAFDARGGRLGYGGGFYDRTLARLQGVIAVGLAYAAQQVDNVPAESTDMCLCAIVTERTVIRR